MLWIPALLLLVTLLLLLGARRRQQEAKLYGVEYWVYQTGTQFPNQNLVMERLLKTGVIGPSEGLLFSDIRLHVVLVLRQKNAHIFRPDLFEDDLTPSKETLEALAAAESLVKVRFVSEEPLKDDRPMKLLPCLALEIARMGRSAVVYDLPQKRLLEPDELADEIKKSGPSSVDLHVRVRWNPFPEPHAITYGLAKKGMPELITGPMEIDERNLVCQLMQEAAKSAWEAGVIPEEAEVELYGGRFRMVYDAKHTARDQGRVQVRMLRVQKA